MKKLMLTLVVILSFANTKAQIGNALPIKNDLVKETIKERVIRDGFKTEGAPKQEDLWLIELKGLKNEDAIKEVARRKKEQQVKGIGYNLNSQEEKFIRYIIPSLKKNRPFV